MDVIASAAVHAAVLPVPVQQHVELSFDYANRTINGTTELKCTCSNGHPAIGLHALGLDILEVSVNGAPAQHQWLPPRLLPPPHEDCSLAEHAENMYAGYLELMQSEAEANLNIILPEEAPAAQQQGEQQQGEQQAEGAAPGAAAGAAAAEPGGSGQRELVIAIRYSKSCSDASVLWWQEWVAVVPQLRRARAWLPCVDLPTVLASFSISITTAPSHVAVCSGHLRSQSLQLRPGPEGKEHEPLARTFHFSTSLPTSPSQLLLAAGPFTLLPHQLSHSTSDGSSDMDVQLDRLLRAREAAITHAGPRECLGALRATLKGVHLPLQQYEAYLGAAFPLPALQVAVLPAELLPGQLHAGLGCVLLSSSLLAEEAQLEKQMEAQRVLAGALARQIFGGLLMPEGPADGWVLAGLAGHLAGVYLRQLLGPQELALARHTERQAVAAGDDGRLAPLHAQPPRLRVGAALYGSTYGTEVLEPSPVRDLKAVAVVAMLERLVGPEAFQKLLQRMVEAGAGKARDAAARCISTRKFVKALEKVAGASKKVLQDVVQRCVYTRGCPTITAAFWARRRAQPEIELAVRQQGGEDVRRAAFATRGGLIKLLVHECDGPQEHAVHLPPDEPVVAALLPVRSKFTRKAAKKAAGGAGGGEAALWEHLSDAQQGALAALAVYYVRLDPGSEWLGRLVLHQPEHMWGLQLRSKDVVEQSMAVEGLAALQRERPSFSGAELLAECLRSSGTCWRVRAQAALALGATAHEVVHMIGSTRLGEFLAERMLAAEDNLSVVPLDMSDLGEALVTRAALVGFCHTRLNDNTTPTPVIDLVLHLMEHLDTRAAGCDASLHVAALVEALGSLRPDAPLLLRRVSAMIDRYLARDAAMPSHQLVVTQACLKALLELARHISGAGMGQALEHVQALAAHYAGVALAGPGPGALLPDSAALRVVPPGGADTLPLRAVALPVLLQARYELCGLDSSLGLALGLLAPGLLPHCLRLAVLQCCLQLANTAQEASMAQFQVEERPLVVAQELVAALHSRLLQEGRDVVARHYGFMLLMRLAGQAGTLYRPAPADEELGDGVEGGRAEPSRQISAQPQPTRTYVSAGAAATATAAAAAAPAALAPARPLKFKMGKVAARQEVPGGSQGAVPPPAAAEVPAAAAVGPPGEEAAAATHLQSPVQELAAAAQPPSPPSTAAAEPGAGLLQASVPAEAPPAAAAAEPSPAAPAAPAPVQPSSEPAAMPAPRPRQPSAAPSASSGPVGQVELAAGGGGTPAGPRARPPSSAGRKRKASDESPAVKEEAARIAAEVAAQMAAQMAAQAPPAAAAAAAEPSARHRSKSPSLEAQRLAAEVAAQFMAPRAAGGPPAARRSSTPSQEAQRIAMEVAATVAAAPPASSAPSLKKVKFSTKIKAKVPGPQAAAELQAAAAPAAPVAEAGAGGSKAKAKKARGKKAEQQQPEGPAPSVPGLASGLDLAALQQAYMAGYQEEGQEEQAVAPLPAPMAAAPAPSAAPSGVTSQTAAPKFKLKIKLGKGPPGPGPK